MGITHTYTFAILEVSKATFEEVQAKLKDSYGHTFQEINGKLVIDMHGIALQSEDKKSTCENCGKVEVEADGDWCDPCMGIRNTGEFFTKEADDNQNQ